MLLTKFQGHPRIPRVQDSLQKWWSEWLCTGHRHPLVVYTGNSWDGFFTDGFPTCQWPFENQWLGHFSMSERSDVFDCNISPMECFCGSGWGAPLFERIDPAYVSQVKGTPWKIQRWNLKIRMSMNEWNYDDRRIYPLSLYFQFSGVPQRWILMALFVHGPCGRIWIWLARPLVLADRRGRNV